MTIVKKGKIKSRKLRNITAVKSNDNSIDISNAKKAIVKDNDKSYKKIKTRKIRMTLTKAEEKKIDETIELNDKFSIGFMLVVICLCFIVGIILGYVLYRIAING